MADIAKPARGVTGWDDATDALFDAVNALGGANAATRVPLNIAGSSNITLTTEQVRARLLDLVGATQTITLTFPNITFECPVRNSGDYELTIKRSGSSNTLTLPAGALVTVEG